MQRLVFLAVLIVLTSSAQARSISFRVGSHRVHIERHCRSAPCVSISRSLDWRRKRLEESSDAPVARPVPPAPQTVAPSPPAPSLPPAPPPPTKTIVTAPPAVYAQAASRGAIARW